MQCWVLERPCQEHPVAACGAVRWCSAARMLHSGVLFHPQGTQQSTQIFHGSTKIDIFADRKLYYTDNGILGIIIDILNSD